MTPRMEKIADLVSTDGLLSLLSEEAVAEHEAKARDLANLWCNGTEGARVGILAALLRAELAGIILAGDDDRRAILAERERCAMIVEARRELYHEAAMGFPRLALSEAASSIRSDS